MITKKKTAILLCVLMALSSPLLAKKNSIPLKKLKGIKTIAPVMIQFNRQYNASAKGLSLTTFKVPELSKEEAQFYDTFSKEIIKKFEKKSKISVIDPSHLLTSTLYPSISNKDVKKKFVLPTPYKQVGLKTIKHKNNVKKIKELCNELKVDAIIAFDFDYGVYSASGIGPLVRKRYRLKADVLVIDKEGTILIDTRIKPKHIKGKMGVSIGIASSFGKDDNFYDKLKTKWFKTFEKSIK